MKNIANTQTEESKTFSVKVPVWSWQLLNIIADSREHGTNGNDLVRKCLEFIIESAKIDGPIPTEFQALIDMLKLDTAWHGAFNFSDPAALTDVAQCVLILQQHDDKGKVRKGFGLALIDKPFLPGEKANMTLCVDDILERVMEVATPGIFRRLQRIQEAMDCESVREVLTTIIDRQLIDVAEEDFLAEMPMHGTHTEAGREYAYGKRTKRKPRRNIDTPMLNFLPSEQLALSNNVREYEAALISEGKPVPQKPADIMDEEWTECDHDGDADSGKDVDALEQLDFQPHGGTW